MIKAIKSMFSKRNNTPQATWVSHRKWRHKHILNPQGYSVCNIFPADGWAEEDHSHKPECEICKRKAIIAGVSITALTNGTIVR